MILFRDIKGQDNAIRYLASSLAAGKIANSYIFSGPRGVGRLLTAKAFIMSLMCVEGASRTACGECSNCRRIYNLEHPDLLYIKPEKNKAIRIEEIRQAKDTLNLKPFEASVSVCLIEDAHMMTEEASNALLKLLEEPPGRSLLILITDKKELLLPTVISRCSEVRFRSLTVASTAEIVSKASGVDREKALFLAYFSQGAPGEALEMHEKGILEKRSGFMRELEDIVSGPDLACKAWASEDKDEIIEAVDMMIMTLRDITVAKAGLAEKMVDKSLAGSGIYGFFKGYPADSIYGVLDRLIKLRGALLGNANPKLVAQALPACLGEKGL